jgi:endonuclease-3 related protein
MNNIYSIYKKLYKTYGTQGWWPFLEDGDMTYHPDDFSYPKDAMQIYEVGLGSILTQNTTYLSVVKSLQNLDKKDLINPQNILEIDIDILKELIRPSGYFNQKASYILNFTNFFLEQNGKIPTRKELLKIKGIGEETADSILLYGYNQTEVKVDAYTKRMFTHLGICTDKTKYIDIKNLIEKELEKDIKDKEELLRVYQEFHALIVCHGKKYYSKKPYGVGCFL